MAQKRTNNIKFYLIFMAGTSILALMIYSFGKDFIKNRGIDEEILNLNQQISELENNNFKLAELIKYFDSESFAERKARIELGLVKTGEATVIINGDDNQGQSLSKIDSQENQIKSGDEENNIKKWWKYFFNKKQNQKLN